MKLDINITGEPILKAGLSIMGFIIQFVVMVVVVRLVMDISGITIKVEMLKPAPIEASQSPPPPAAQ